jgi:hypothetical protein
MRSFVNCFCGSVPDNGIFVLHSKTSTSERALVIGLGAVNLFGVIVLNTLLNEMSVRPGGFLTFVKNIYPLLQV